MGVSEEILKPLRIQEFKPEKLRISTRKSSQSGQAVLEYLLVLVVSVGLILGIMYQFNTALKKYVQSYFGDYVACILETGELPSLGGDGGGAPNAESCDAEYEQFSLQNGRPLKSSVGGDGTSSSSNSKSVSSSRGSRSGSGARGSTVRPRVSTASRQASSNAEGRGSNGAGSGNTQKVRKGGRDGAGEDTGSALTSKRYRDGTTYGLSTKFKTGEDKERDVATKKVSARGNLEGGSGGKKQKVLLEDLKRKPAQQSDSGWDLSFGDYIRYLVIFGILIIIFIFFGGQINQLRKSWDSN